MREANRLEADGHRIHKLNIGNPAPFGFEVPEEIVQDVKQKFIACPRILRIQRFFRQKSRNAGVSKKNILNVDIDDIFIGNGVK